MVKCKSLFGNSFWYLNQHLYVSPNLKKPPVHQLTIFITIHPSQYIDMEPLQNHSPAASYFFNYAGHVCNLNNNNGFSMKRWPYKAVLRARCATQMHIKHFKSSCLQQTCQHNEEEEPAAKVTATWCSLLV